MTSAAASPTPFLQRAGAAAATVFAAGWLALYLPIYFDFATSAWRRDENAHALVVLAIILGVAGVRLVAGGLALTALRSAIATGGALVVLGVAMAAIGHSSESDLLASASQLPVALGAVLALFGVAGVRALWFPLAMMLYLVIWPGWALEFLTGPLKQLVSQVVTEALYAAGLPIAHAGAVISAGPYQLLVADACSGLNSLIALTAVGAVYLFAVKHQDWRINLVVLAVLAPIAIAANMIRVALLVLITYFLGYDAGQGFLHDGAGLVMFAAALGMVFLTDAVAIFAFSRGKRAPQ